MSTRGATNEAPSANLLNACGAECVRWGKGAGVALDAMHGGDDGFATIAPVGSFPRGASRYGVEDVVGNVWEWVADWYGPYGSHADAGRSRHRNGARHPRGRLEWKQPRVVRPTFRYKDRPTKRSHGIGFRCAADRR